MSIFLLQGGRTQEPFPEDKLSPEMWEDRFFKPGIIHGANHLTRVYLNDAHGEIPGIDHNQFEVEFIWPETILEAAEKDPTLADGFWEYIAEELESFGVDSMHNDFAVLAHEWHNAVPMNAQELYSWAKGENH